MDADRRWQYHQRAIELIASGNNKNPKILEIGTMGMPLSDKSDLLDISKHIDFYEEGKLAYVHDLKYIPWPISSSAYDWVVALRVFHHLWPLQRECFEEAMRISKNVILVIPAMDNHEVSHSISPADLRLWNSGRPASIIEPISDFGFLYAWLQEK